MPRAKEPTGYAALTEKEKWQWHTDTYAWRIVHGYGFFDDIATGRYSPTDPKGEFWDENAVRTRVNILLADRKPLEDAKKREQATMSAEVRPMLNAWATRHGYLDWDAVWEDKMKPGKKEGFLTGVIRDLQQMFPEEFRRRRMPKARATHYTASDLGVRAEPAKIPDGQVDYLKSILANRLGKATGEAAE